MTRRTGKGQVNAMNWRRELGPVWDREADKREWNKRNAAPDPLLRLWATQFNVRDFQWPAATQRAFNASSLAGLFRFFGP